MTDHGNEEQRASPYAGRWVARLGGRIVAHGGTPEQARAAAQRSRYKERAEISFMPPSASFSVPPLVERVHQILSDSDIFLVGGAVRDALLGKVSHDLDFAVPTDAIAAARRVASGLHADFYVLDQNFDAARVIVQGPATDQSGRPARDILDFSSFREPRSGGVTNLDADLKGRDFTINAIAYDPRHQTILDPLNGTSDLRAKTIRACSPSAMDDDSIRILRAVRLAAALDFKIEPATRQAMKAAASRLPTISPERQRDELFKTLDGPRPDASLRAFEILGVFPYVMPELTKLKGVEQSAPHIQDVWGHTLSVLYHLEDILTALAPGYDAEKNNDLFTGLLSLRLGRYRDRFAQHFATFLNTERSIRALLLFAALYHDVAKPAMKAVDETGRIRFIGHEKAGAEVVAQRGKAFSLSTDEIQRLQTIVANHMRFPLLGSQGDDKTPSRRTIYRFFRDTGEAGVDLLLLGLADLRGVRGHTLTQESWSDALDVARVFLENYWEKPEEAVAPPRLVSGDDLMAELGLLPGPIVGELLREVREAQAIGEVKNRAEALEFARQRKKDPSQS